MVLVSCLMLTHSNFVSGQESPCQPRQPYEAPQYIPPPKAEPLESRLIDNSDGTISDPATGLMWTKKDSYADLNKCLNWKDSEEYVKNLGTGGYTDWRIPTILELSTLYDHRHENVLAWDADPEYPLALDSKFEKGAAYWNWSSDCGTTDLTECCAKTFYFVNGMIQMRHFELCNNGGIRAVRDIKQAQQ